MYLLRFLSLILLLGLNSVVLAVQCPNIPKPTAQDIMDQYPTHQDQPFTYHFNDQNWTVTINMPSTYDPDYTITANEISSDDDEPVIIGKKSYLCTYTVTFGQDGGHAGEQQATVTIGWTES